MNLFRRLHVRVLALVAVGVVLAGAGAGLAFASGAKSAPIGTGVVVVDTNLAYENGAAAGTGMVLTPSGEVLTNNHVIKGATSITVVVPGTAHTYNATVVGYDVSDDVAILQLTSASNLKTVKINTAKLAIGKGVTALGNAGGTGALVPAKGAITGLGKSITASDDQGAEEQLTGLIETNAALQPGDSGGPLLDGSGRVVGMDTAASTGFGYQAVMRTTDAYAIPIAKALSIAKAIEAGAASATVHIGGTAFLGVQVESDPSGAGVYIAGVIPGGPSDAAGLAAGDEITSVDGQSVAAPTDVTSVLLAEQPGTTISVGYTDQAGVSQTADVTLGDGPAQ